MENYINYINKVKTAYSKYGEDRVFFGTLTENQFKVYTYPDKSKSFLKPILFFRRMFVFAAPSCIYGYISEGNKQTIMRLIDSFYSGIKI